MRGSASRRGEVTGKDWRNPALWQRYAGHLSPYLQWRIDGLKLERAAPKNAEVCQDASGRLSKSRHRNRTLRGPVTKRLLILLAAFVLASTEASAATNIWQAKSSGSFVTLRYGPLIDREHPRFLLSCLNSVKIAVLSVYMDFPERETGAAITVTFSAGGQSTTVAGETAAEDGTGVIYGEAGDIAVAPILKVLREKGSVSMKSGAIGYDMSDAGRADAVAKFTKDCTLD
jgi:hypothetical protein